jgi:hypothetical protein
VLRVDVLDKSVLGGEHNPAIITGLGEVGVVVQPTLNKDNITVKLIFYWRNIRSKIKVITF